MRPAGRKVCRYISVPAIGRRGVSGAFAKVRRVRSGALGPFPFALGVVRFGPFQCAVGFVRLRSVHSRSPCGTYDSFVCVQSILVRPGCRRSRWRMFGQSRSPLGASSLFLCVWSIPVHGVVHSGALGPLPFPLG